MLFDSPHSRDAAGKKYALTHLPQSSLVCDGASLCYWLHGQRTFRHNQDGGDGSVRLRMHTDGLQADHLGGEYRDTARKARRFARGLAAAGVKLTVVFEPGRLTAPEAVRKLDAWAARSARSTHAVGELHAYISSGGASTAGGGPTNLPAPELDVEQVTRTLREEGVEITISLAAEADDDLAAFVRDGHAFAVLSDDSDFSVIAGCRMLPFSFLDAHALLHGPDDVDGADASHSSADAAWRSATAWVFEPASVIHALGLANSRQLFTAICLVGHDTTSGLVDTWQVPAKLGVPPNLGVRDVAHWLRGIDSGSPDQQRCDMLLRSVPRLVGMSGRDATAWQEAINAAEAVYLSGCTGSWVASLPAHMQVVAGHTAQDALPSWALAAVAHRTVWLPRSPYERPWGPHPGGGLAAAHVPVRRRMYATLIGTEAQVVEYGWDGQFWGSDIMQTAVTCEPPQLLPPSDDAFPWLGMRALLLGGPARAAMMPAKDDPAFALPSAHFTWATLLLRYLLTLNRVSDALVVQRLTAWQAEACIACVACCLDVARAEAAGEPVPSARGGVWRTPPWRFMEVSAILQSCIGIAYAATDVASPGSRRGAPPPLALFSGSELLRLYTAAEQYARAVESQTEGAYSIASWADADGPAWWATALEASSPGALSIARTLLRAACGGIHAWESLFDTVAPDDTDGPSPALELLRLWAQRDQWSIQEGSAAVEDVDAGFGAEMDVDDDDDDVAVRSKDAAQVASRLPVEQHLEALRQLAGANHVVCISGETGCGKSTVVPLELLRSCAPADAMVLVTQPRRIAAVSLARSVADMLGQSVGHTVGYAIGGHRVLSPATRLLFVTTGWLLRLASASGSRTFGRASHIVLDEAHVRSLDADFLTLLLRRRIMRARSMSDVPRLVFMSATLQADLFGPYFASAMRQSVAATALNAQLTDETPALHVGARRFPVAEIYLDELNEKLALRNEQALSNARAECAEMSGGRRLPGMTSRLTSILAYIVLHVARLGCTVLVFLPGAAEIENVQVMLNMATGGKFNLPIDVFPMHSMMLPEQQAAAISSTPPDRARVLLATDIVESSVTLPDVLVVVDACLQRAPCYDGERDMTRMATRYVSQASAAQRAGRAGRVRPGTVVRLLPKARFLELEPHDDPELLFVALDNVVLRGMQLVDEADPEDNVQALLANALSPPPAENVQWALQRLLERGAIYKDGSPRSAMSPLGRFAASLARLPVTVARMLLIGLAAGAARDAVVLACAITMSSPSPFKQVLSMFSDSPLAYARDVGANTRARLAVDDGMLSDPMGWVRTFELFNTDGHGMGRSKWRDVRSQISMRAMRNFRSDIRTLARDVPSAARAAGLTLTEQQLAELRVLSGVGANDDATAEDTEDIITSYSTDEDVPLPSKGVKGAAGSNRHQGDESRRMTIQRWLLLFACGQNLLKAEAIFKPPRGNVVHEHRINPNKTAVLGAPDEVLDAGPEAIQQILSRVVAPSAIRKVARKDGKSMLVEFSDAAVKSQFVDNASTLAMRELVAIQGSSPHLNLPAPESLKRTEKKEGASDATGKAGQESPDTVAFTFKLPGRFNWTWLCGTSGKGSTAPRVHLTFTGALHGLYEPEKVVDGPTDVLPRESSRRYACAGELMSFGRSGGHISGRIVTMLPTRGVDAELWMLATWQVGMPPLGACVTRDGRLVSLTYGQPGSQEPTWLMPWSLTRADLARVNALRLCLNRLVLGRNGGDDDAHWSSTDMALQVESFLAHCAAAAEQKPVMSTGGQWVDIMLTFDPDCLGPWPPYNLSAIDDGQAAASIAEAKDAYVWNGMSVVRDV